MHFLMPFLKMATPESKILFVISPQYRQWYVRPSVTTPSSCSFPLTYSFQLTNEDDKPEQTLTNRAVQYRANQLTRELHELEATKHAVDVAGEAILMNSNHAIPSTNASLHAIVAQVSKAHRERTLKRKEATAVIDLASCSSPVKKHRVGEAIFFKGRSDLPNQGTC